MAKERLGSAHTHTGLLLNMPWFQLVIWPSLSAEQTSFLKENFRDQWLKLIDSNATTDAEKKLKVAAVREAIGTADNTKPPHSLFEPLQGPSDWPYARIHQAWVKPIKTWFSNTKHQYRLKTAVTSDLLGASQPSPEVTAARQKIFKLIGESPKDRWIEDNSELINAEMNRLVDRVLRFKYASS
ncbi:hypothetical protein BKA70DRAFT_1232396 [Coprinopsis sp. MPI-PUGE-AT-0042]|nr:hypothetical protein BKA70DRAFT_1232396 [Coprinopsis sp. MPI-PUGE-AT-0042]